MKKFLLFLFTALTFCFMTGCGERKMSEEEIQKKSEALCMKVFELKEKGEYETLIPYYSELFHYHDLLSDANPYKELLFYFINQHMGIVKYEMRQYAEAIPLSEKALNSDVDKIYPEMKEEIQKQKLDICIALMKSYHKTGNIPERDRKRNDVKKAVESQIASNKQKQYTLRSLDTYYFFCVVESDIRLDLNQNTEALNLLLKMEELYSLQSEYSISSRKDVLFRIARIYFKEKDWDKSIEYSKRSIDIYAGMNRFPDYVYVLLIRAYLQKKEYDTALRDSEKYLQWCDRHPLKENLVCKADIYYCMGKLYQILNQTQKGESFLKSASEIVPMQTLDKTLGHYF